MNQTLIRHSLADVLIEDDILLDMAVTRKNQLFDKVASHLSGHAALNPGLVSRRLAEREALGSTGLGQGVAIPHARIPGLTHAIAAFVRPKVAMAFDAPDGKPVYAILVLLVPETANEQHLQLLAVAAQLFCDKDFRATLRACEDAASIYRLLIQR